jgi:hypothetical protein
MDEKRGNQVLRIFLNENGALSRYWGNGSDSIYFFSGRIEDL